MVQRGAMGWCGVVDIQLVTLLYNVGHWERLKWRTATPGAAMTTILMVLLSVGFSFHCATEHLQSVVRIIGNADVVVGLGQCEHFGPLFEFELDASIEKAPQSQGEVSGRHLEQF